VKLGKPVMAPWVKADLNRKLQESSSSQKFMVS